MKTIKYLFSLAVGAALLTISAQAQNQSGVDSTGLPGDNFSLQGALQMFQNAASPEAFEQAINTEGNRVNNLDLDGDGDIDYVKVVSKMDKDVHAFILQVAISEKETQDIAVIELEKTGKETAVIQIIGDEDIYGEQVIVEPDGGGENARLLHDDHINNSNLSGPNASFDYEAPAIVVNVWLWPSVRFIYAPGYRPWVSPWRWHYYPAYWKPWRPYSWQVWNPFRIHYHRPFVVVRTHRVIHAHRIYTPYRSTSVVVRNRHSASVNNYRVTRTRTTVTGPRGKTTTVKRTTVTGPRGGKATKVKVRRH
ncbi:MAG: hypothetical protein JNM19_03730 [Chitinophagaceae bacterium]|nr:hypothetical protein [Chitinophagaceae bacterium]